MFGFKNTHNYRAVEMNQMNPLCASKNLLKKFSASFNPTLLAITLLFSPSSAQKKCQLPEKKIEVGANQVGQYLPLLHAKRIGIVANQTSVIFKNKDHNKSLHLVDSLLKLEIDIAKIFTPEHGFRGRSDASEFVPSSTDQKTGLPLVSLYGAHKKPTAAQLRSLNLIIFDIQDVGVRFYTYLSTLHYVMEACAENDLPLLILDRPNPNGHYIDGPVLSNPYKSFVGMHPVPVVYGMTLGEYAKMINGEGWLKNGITCDLRVIPLKNYTHQSAYSLPIRPSPNLPNSTAVNLYPSLGFFEGTSINAGRGTEYQFQRYGAPDFPKNAFYYTPRPNFGSKSPKHNGKKCYGVSLKASPRQNKINLSWLVDAFEKTPDKNVFFGSTFTQHAGNERLQKQIEKGMSARDIENSWKKDLVSFQKIRRKYLLYK